MTRSPTEIILEFLCEIGLTVIERTVPTGSVLPGISIDHGALVVDHAALLYPGDLLHEAGHLAVVPPAERAALTDNVGDDGGMEMAAIAWSYAAAVHLGVPLDVLFHDHGYRGHCYRICHPQLPPNQHQVLRLQYGHYHHQNGYLLNHLLSHQ